MEQINHLVLIPSRRQFRLNDGPTVGPLADRLWTLLVALSDLNLWSSTKLAMEVWPAPSGDYGVTLNSVYTAVYTLKKLANSPNLIKAHGRCGYILQVDSVEISNR